MNREQQIQDTINRIKPKEVKEPTVQDLYGKSKPQIINGNDKK